MIYRVSVPSTEMSRADKKELSVVDFSIVSVSKLSELMSVTFRLENKNQIWDDTLMMTGTNRQRPKLIPVIPLAKIGILLNRPHYIEDGMSPIRSS